MVCETKERSTQRAFTVSNTSLKSGTNEDEWQLLPPSRSWASQPVQTSNRTQQTKTPVSLTNWKLAGVGSFWHCLSGNRSLTPALVPAGSPSRGGDVTVYVLDINQPSLPTLFIQFLCLFLPLWPFQRYFIYKFSRQLSAFSLCSSGLILRYWSFGLYISL